MRALEGEGIRLRIYVGESDKYEGRPLYKALVDFFRSEKMAGATVYRGVLGFGAKSHMHSADILRLSEDLPITVEVVDSEERLKAVTPQLDAMISDGLVTMEKVKVIRYAPKKK